MSFEEILRELRRCRYVIAATTLLGVGLALAYWWTAPEEYESWARMLVLPKDPAMASATHQGETFDREDVSDDLLATHIEVLRSDAIVTAALERTELNALASIEPHLKPGQSIAEYVIGRLWASQGGDGNARDARIINVGFRHYDPEDARRVVSAIVSAYQEFLDAQFEDVSSEATGLIAQAQVQLEREIELLESEQLDLRQQGPIQVTRGDRVSNIHEDQFAEIESEISGIRLRLSDANSRLEAIAAARAGGEISASGIDGLSFIDEGDTARLSLFHEMVRMRAAQPAFLIQQPLRAEAARVEYDRLVSLRAEERTLLEDFGARHPDVTKVQNEIAVLEETLNKRQQQLDVYDSRQDIDAAQVLDAYTDALTCDVRVMKDRLAELETMARQEEARAKELVNFELSGKVLASRIERKQQLYDAVVSRLHDVSLRSNYGSLFHDVLVPPQTGKRVWPRLSICGLAGAAAGMLLGLGIMLATYLARKTFRTVGEMSRGLPVPVLATIPRLAGSRLRRRSATRSSASRSQWSRLLELEFANQSPAAQALRSLRSVILLGGRRTGHSLLLVTSPNRDDGKTVVASNLALAVARSGRSVLLIDAHAYDPQLHRLFGCEATPGLAEVLEGGVELQDALQAVDTHLRILPAGQLSESAADVYQSERFAHFCELVRERFELVVFDGPPALNAAEVPALAGLMDQVALVSRVAKNTRADIRTACGEIQRHGGRLQGVIANAWDAPRGFAHDAADIVSPQPPGDWPVENKAAANGHSEPEILSARP